MSENAPEAAAETAAPAEQTPPAQETDWKAEFEKVKAEARKWEGRAKENKEAADELQKLKGASQSDAERIAALEKLAADAAAKALRAEVANVKGVPASLLTGSTQEELEASADALLAFRGEQKPGTPRPDPSQGSQIPPHALNGDPLLADLKSKLGIS